MLDIKKIRNKLIKQQEDELEVFIFNTLYSGTKWFSYSVYHYTHLLPEVRQSLDKICDVKKIRGYVTDKETGKKKAFWHYKCTLKE